MTLGLLILFLVTLLCVPVGYRLDASMPGKDKGKRARGRVTWLLHLIRIDVSFEEQELKWRVRIAVWKSFGSEPQKSGRTDTQKKKSREDLGENRAWTIRRNCEERVCRRRKQSWKAARQLRRITGKNREFKAKTEKCAESLVQKTLESVDSFNRKRKWKNRRRTPG